jgi:Sensors of blue-light using FAD
MFRLVYVSTCAPGLSLDDVYAIMRVSPPWNVTHGVSGMLCWSGEFFLQCLEGERSEVSKTFARIVNDARHTDVEILIAAPTAVRWFGEWGMGFSRLMASHRLDLPSGRGQSFNPYLLEASDLESAFEQLSQFAQRLSIE